MFLFLCPELMFLQRNKLAVSDCLVKGQNISQFFSQFILFNLNSVYFSLVFCDKNVIFYFPPELILFSYLIKPLFFCFVFIFVILYMENILKHVHSPMLFLWVMPGLRRMFFFYLFAITTFKSLSVNCLTVIQKRYKQ